ncbi:MAG: 1-(5-phosphoribosyl)-5-[(5-phosphoribosylamino)methylideneamino]imidazole-4-carboxamide isomerase [Christensenellales bacterium]|jgi:phosphoribosylformimino-5-aminoimidazole carboxamide ribotide isomerase
MLIFPAIDLSEGCVVRLFQGDYNQKKVYDDDPLQVAKSFAMLGATHLHVVDLDGAKAGESRNAEVVERIARESGLFVQIGGGIRNMERVRRYLACGAGRVILGTAAVKDPAFLKEALAAFGEGIAVGVDARRGKVALSGWLEDTDMDSFRFCEQLRDLGVQTVIYTDIEKDGGLQGTNLAAYERLKNIANLNVIASGGISSEEDLKALFAIGVHGAIIGKALYEGRLDLSRALSIAQQRRTPC